MYPRWLSAPGRLHIVYAENGRELRLADPAALPSRYRVIDPRSGAVLAKGKHRGFADSGYEVLGPFGDGPCVVIFTSEAPLPYASADLSIALPSSLERGENCQSGSCLSRPADA